MSDDRKSIKISRDVYIVLDEYKPTYLSWDQYLRIVCSTAEGPVLQALREADDA